MKDMAIRNTVQRELVLDAVNRLRFHPTADDIYHAVIEERPKVSKATVYRNLAFLVETGAVTRIEVPDGADHFDYQVFPHYHVKCSVCGRVDDVDMPYLDGITSIIEDTHGFTIDGHNLVFTGLCPACAQGKGEDKR